MMIAARRRIFAAAVFSGCLYPCIAGANDNPLEIIQKMYRDFLAKNYTDAINTKKNRSRYFVPALARLYDADEVQACVPSIEATGQETINTAQIDKSLSLSEKSNDGKHAVVVSNFRNGGPPESFRYEFVKQGNAWKISDVIFPNGDRFSHTDCGSGRLEDRQPRPLAGRSKAANYLVAEAIAGACDGKKGKIDSASVIERDLTGDGKADLIISDEGITCADGTRSLGCGMQVCSVNIYVRRGELLKLALETLGRAR